MQIKIIKQGSSGPLVRIWQDFLRGQDIYLGVSDGKFGPQTEEATKKYQANGALVVDGIVGNRSWGHAMEDGLQLVEDTSEGKGGSNWPPIPKGVKAAQLATRQKLFGAFRYEPAPTKSNPEGLKILGDWISQSIVKVTIPQLKGVLGAPNDGQILWHKVAVDQIKGLFQAWEDEGLIHLVRSWAGSWNPRFIRGSRSVLSNHAFASAFDINVPGNGLRRQPALVGEPWSVRELVPLAVKYGFFWGGWWGYPGSTGSRRYDGMHFEIMRLL